MTNEPTTLDQLLARMHEDPDYDATNAPTFGGSPIPQNLWDTVPVWSWDTTRVLIGTGEELEIIPRAQFQEQYA